MHKLSILILLPILLTECTRADEAAIPDHLEALDHLTMYPADAAPAMDIQLVREQTFGDTGGVIMGYIAETEVDESGKVFIVAPNTPFRANTIHVFLPDGRLLTDVGREGRGPGEFEFISGMHVHHNRLLVYDSRLSRIQLFALDPVALVHTIILRPQVWNDFEGIRFSRPSVIYGLTDSTFLAGVTLNEREGQSYWGYYTLNWEGEVISEKIIEQLRPMNHTFQVPGSEMAGGVELPFSRKSVMDIAANGMIYSAHTGEFLIRVYNAEGEYQRSMYYPYHKAALSRDSVLSNYESFMHVAEAGIPETWPALARLLVDDENRLWVATIVEDPQVYRWWMLEASGELLARFTWPRAKPIMEVRGGCLYTREINGETNQQQIVRYRIEIS